MKTWEYFIILEKEKLTAREIACFVENIPSVIHGNLDIWERERERERDQNCNSICLIVGERFMLEMDLHRP